MIPHTSILNVPDLPLSNTSILNVIPNTSIPNASIRTGVSTFGEAAKFLVDAILEYFPKLSSKLSNFRAMTIRDGLEKGPEVCQAILPKPKEKRKFIAASWSLPPTASTK